MTKIKGIKSMNNFFAFLFRLFRIKNLTVYQLTLSILIITTVFTVGLIFTVWTYSETLRVKSRVKALKKISFNQQKEELKTEVKQLIFYLEYLQRDTVYYTTEELKNKALLYFENIRFGNDGYVFINTYDGFALLFDGQRVDKIKDVNDLTDPSGFKIFKKELELAKLPDGGYFQYLFKKIYDDKPYSKLSYVIGFNKWKWIVGTGDYLDNIEEEIALLEKDLEKDMHRNIFIALGILMVIFVILILLAYRLAHWIQDQFNKFVLILKPSSLNEGDSLSIDDIFIRELKIIGLEIIQAEELAKKFGDIINQSLNEIYIFDQNNLNFVHANHGAIKNCGYSLDELKLITPHDLKPELNYQQFMNLIAPLIEKKTNHIHFEAIHQRKDKTLYPVDINLTLSLFNDKPVFIAFVYDITERKEAETKLQLSQQRYSNLFENAPISLWEEDFTDLTEYLNAQLKKYKLPIEELFEKYPNILPECASLIKVVNVNNKTIELFEAQDKEELLGNLNILFTEASFSVFKQSLLALYRGEKYFSSEGENRSIKGKKLNVLLRWSFLFNNDKELTQKVTVSIIDVTELRKKEENLNASEVLFRNIVEYSFEAIGLIDNNYTFTYANNNLAKLFGYPLNEIIGFNFKKFLSAESLDLVVDRYRRRQKGEDVSSQYEIILLTKNGKKVYAKLSSSVIFSKGKSPQTLVQLIDNTEGKKIEEERKRYRLQLEKTVEDRTSDLKESQVALLNLVDDLNIESKKLMDANKRLEEINEELETFTYSVSHDLKAPLRGIDGYSQLLQESYNNDLSSEAQGFLANIRKSTQQMNVLIEDLLSYSRMERKMFLNEDVKLKDLIDNIFEFYIKTTHKATFTFINNVSEALIIKADNEGLKLVLRNLIDNAVKFSSEGKKTKIEVGCIEKDTHWIIFVKDNGIGFNMKYHDRIFKIFQRLHLAEEYDGTGIGLAIVAKAMQRMNGKIWAESDIGKGSCFYLEIGK